MNPENGSFGSHVGPPSSGVLRTPYVLLLSGSTLGVIFQGAYLVYAIVALGLPIDARIPWGIFALGMPMTTTLVGWVWFVHRLRVLSPWVDQALSNVRRH